MPRPLVTNPSLPAGRVALRCGGNVLVELESYGRGPKWLPRPFAGGMIFPWWTRTACLGPSEAGSVVLIYLTRAGQSRGASSGLGPASPVDEVAARRDAMGLHLQVLLYLRQPGVGPGDQPGVPGYLLRAVPMAEGPPALFGPALGNPLHAGDAVERGPEVVVVDEPVLRRDQQFQRVAAFLRVRRARGGSGAAPGPRATPAPTFPGPPSP